MKILVTSLTALALVAATPALAQAPVPVPPSVGNAYVDPPAPVGAPTSPTIVSPNGDVLVTGSVGSPRIPPSPTAGICATPHGSCPSPLGFARGQVCDCFVPGIGAEQGITR